MCKRLYFVAAAMAACLVAVGCASLPAATEDTPSSAPSPAAARTFAPVFTWTGGGPESDIRDSESFELLGGEQRIVITWAPAGEFGPPSVDWTVASSDGGGVMKSVVPPSSGIPSSAYLPAGLYHVSAITGFCTWTVIVQELR